METSKRDPWIFNVSFTGGMTEVSGDLKQAEGYTRQQSMNDRWDDQLTIRRQPVRSANTVKDEQLLSV